MTTSPIAPVWLYVDLSRRADPGPFLVLWDDAGYRHQQGFDIKVHDWTCRVPTVVDCCWSHVMIQIDNLWQPKVTDSVAFGGWVGISTHGGGIDRGIHFTDYQHRGALGTRRVP
jgi:hypothetical protein